MDSTMNSACHPFRFVNIYAALAAVKAACKCNACRACVHVCDVANI